MGLALLPQLAFISNLAGPDMILILLVVGLLFWTNNLGRGWRKLSGNENEDEPDFKWRHTVRPPYGAAHPLISRFGAPFLIVMLLSTLFLLLIWLKNGP